MPFEVNMTDEKIIEEYIKDYESKPQKYRSRAEETLDWLAKNQPQRAWDIIVKLIQVSTNNSLNAYIAAGPIEDLLVHYPEIIEKVEEDAFGDEKLCGVLDCVWKNRMTDQTWEKLQHIINIQFNEINMKMQKLLKERGYAVEEDGFIGIKTMEAVNKFREENHLSVDSVEEIIDELEKDGH